MKKRKLLLILLSLSLLLTACTAVGNPVGTPNGADTATPVTTPNETDDRDTSAETEGQTGTETAPETAPETEEEMRMPVEPIEIKDRYFIFRIWNFRILSLAEFKQIVDKVETDGFNAIKVHIPWHHVETQAGVYDYEAFDAMVQYVADKGMKVAISLDLTRRKGDTLLSEDDIMRDAEGNLCMGGSVTGDRLQISLNSEVAMDKAVAFYRDAVAHYHALLGDKVLFYLPAFSQYAETEYWCAGDYDHSDNAKAAFHAFLRDTYGTVGELNRVLGADYASFDAVDPPAGTAADTLGRLWYVFRHQSLKTAIDRLAAAQDEAAEGTKFAIQLGCVYDTASTLRVTFGVRELCEHVDVLWVDDGPLMNHHFTMDYVRSLLPASIELAQEIDGPHQSGATPERYLEQGLVCFERGCTYVSAANWSMDALYEEYRPVWQEISDTWLGEATPAVVQPGEDAPRLEISLSELFARRNSDKFVTQYKKLAKDGAFVYIRVTDDLTASIPTEPILTYAFPGDFSGEQGKGGWYYRSCQRGKMTDMTFDAQNNRWQGSREFSLIMNGAMHPDTVDTALTFKAPKDGAIVIHPAFSLASDQGDGVILYLLHNGVEVEIGDARNGGVLITHDTPYEADITLTVAEGDEISFVINRNNTTSFDSTNASVQIEYR